MKIEENLTNPSSVSVHKIPNIKPSPLEFLDYYGISPSNGPGSHKSLSNPRSMTQSPKVSQLGEHREFKNSSFFNHGCIHRIKQFKPLKLRSKLRPKFDAPITLDFSVPEIPSQK